MAIMIERHQITSRDQWLALRKHDVTASRVGALFGVHPYVTALKLYLEHSGIEFPQEESAVMRRGRLLEGAVALAVADERPEWTIVKNQFYFRDPELRLGATPDFLIEGDPRGLGVLQTKTAAPHIYERDWESGKTVPFWVTLQTLTECLLTDAVFGVVAPMQIDAFDLACSVIEIPRHATSENRITTAVAEFWDDVAHGREPAPDYGKDKNLIPYLMPRAAKDKIIDLSGDNELPTLLDQRAKLMDTIKLYSERCDEIETEVRFKMRDAERVTGLDGWSITWKNQHREPKLVPAKDFRVLRIFDKRESA
jgi:predicted phage-related endonuclease